MIIDLTNGIGTWPCRVLASDQQGPIRVIDLRGMRYTRCETGACDHSVAPPRTAVWHDDEFTETLWVPE